MISNLFRPNFDIEKNSIHLIGLSCNTIPPVKYGGIELVIANLATGFTKNGFNVRVYSPGVMDIAQCEHSQTLREPTTGIQSGSAANTKEHLLRIEEDMRKYCVPGDVIIFNHSDHFRFLKKRLGRIFYSRVNTFEIAHWVDAGLYKNIIYPSHALMKLLKKKGYVIPHGEQLIYNESDSCTRGMHLLYAGRITEDKGIELALEASELIGCKLRIAAPHANTKFFSDTINHSNVEYLGELNYRELFLEYQSARAFIYMTQYVEPFGLAVIEAMAAGCPVITTGNGGTGETVINGETGYFCKNVEEIESAYRNVHTLNSNNIVAHSRKYSVESMISQYEKVILGSKN